MYCTYAPRARRRSNIYAAVEQEAVQLEPNLAATHPGCALHFWAALCRGCWRHHRFYACIVAWDILEVNNMNRNVGRNIKKLGILHAVPSLVNGAYEKD